MKTFTYFAYGSNMLLERLRAETRCPSAEAVGVGLVENFEVHFTKRSTDLSGKATLVRRKGAQIYGVLFTIDVSERPCLDAAEGHGYEPLSEFAVTALGTGRLVGARTYSALPGYLDKGLGPYDWYHALVLAGATQNQLPNSYVEALSKVGATVDLHSGRSTRLEALRALKQSGFGHLMKS